MRISDEQINEFVRDSKLVGDSDLSAAYEEAKRQNHPLGSVLIEKKLIDETQLRKLYSYILGIPFVDLQKEIIPTEILQVIPEPIARKYKIVAFEKKEKELKVAMLNPEDIQTIDFIRKKAGLILSLA